MLPELRSRITVFASACLAGLVAWFLVFGGTRGPDELGLVPVPQRVVKHHGKFVLKPEARILANAEARATGEYLARQLRRSTHFALPVGADSESPSGNIVLSLDPALADLGLEGYKLVSTPISVRIVAGSVAGLFYGVQSLFELLPPAVFVEQSNSETKWELPCVAVTDRPRFPWRGMLLDVSRHFFRKDEIKHVFDWMALHKLNVFHWHLTDDQGWRIEIKKYPRLTEVGAWRTSIGFNLDPKSSNAYGPDGRYGGFYTQAEVRELVAYAQERHITIVPEIEMPGHATAALAAYPEFSCFGGPYFTDVVQNTRSGVYCAGREETFKFIEDVLSEITELFPGKYIHVGGDEVSTQNWQDCPHCQERVRTEGLRNAKDLQNYFIHRVANFLNTHGRRLIGWSEIADGGLPEGAVLMDWIGGAVPATRSGHDVVMSPTGYCYLDYYQSQGRASEPPAIGGYLPLEKVYGFEPIPPELEPPSRSHILGAQANLWTEYIPSLRALDYMMFPRLCALAEVVWSPATSRDWEAFQQRLRVHLERLREMGVNYRAKPSEAN